MIFTDILKDVGDFCNMYNLYPGKIVQDPNDKLLIYDGGIILSANNFSSLPKELLFFKGANGGLNLDFCEYLTDITNLRNFIYIKGRLDLEGTAIENLKGLENLQAITYIDITNCENFKSFDGLNPFVKIYGLFDVHKIYPKSREDEFLEWQKSKHIQEISKFISCV